MAEEILRIPPDQVRDMVKKGKIEIVTAPPRVERVVDSNSSIESAKTLFDANFLGPNEIEKAFGMRISPENVPPVHFTQEELERAKELDQRLILRVNKAPDGKALTMKKISEMLQPQFDSGGKGKILWNTDWYKKESFFIRETPRARWALVGKNVLSETTSNDYLTQTRELLHYLQDEVFSGRLPSPYEGYREELVREDSNLVQLVKTDTAEASKKLTELGLNQAMRQTAVEALYDLLMVFQNTGVRDFSDVYTWTVSRTSDGFLVSVGLWASAGLLVDGYSPGRSLSDLGVCPSR